MTNLSRIFIICLFHPFQAFAFDKMECTGKLNSWTISTAEKSNRVILSDKITPLNINEKDSSKILLKDGKGKLIASIFPWNSVYIRLNENSKKNVKVKLTEELNGFEANFFGPEKMEERSLSCRFSF